MEADEPAERRRFARAGLKDPRLIVGLVLVVASVLGVVALVQSFERTQAVYAAARDLGAGHALTPEDLVVVEVRLGESAGAYLSAAQPPPAGTRVSSAVRRGELIPLRAVAEAAETRRPMSLELAGGVPAGVGVGSSVDVYVTQSDPAATEAPRLVLSSLEVTGVSASSAGLAGSAATRIEVLVPPEDVAALVAARAAERIDVVAGAPLASSGAGSSP
ncbi:MAG: SAF domain-containing protein [Arthrobacter sp.]|jgi:hypothetical protein|nr:SAF domain-containing protein [Arthrobacter sp.]